MTATVSFRHPGGTPGEFNDETGARDLDPFPPYYGPDINGEGGIARIQAMSTQAAQALAAEQTITTQAYLVTIPAFAELLAGAEDFAVDDLGVVDAVGPHGDVTLVGRELTVQAVIRGSLTFERDLVCTDALG